ncbi:hypothetical protein A1OO_08780 [Enterovibrio norvegicus FF-33]|nr:hypothetical protein A1OO_08780 [Enterovibrio norvegicus FF-33]
MLTVDLIVKSLGGVQKVATTFSVSRTAVLKWRSRGIPEYVHLLCHISSQIPYTYDPSAFGKDEKALGLNLVKPTDDQTVTSEEIANDKSVYSEAA